MITFLYLGQFCCAEGEFLERAGKFLHTAPLKSAHEYLFGFLKKAETKTKLKMSDFRI